MNWSRIHLILQVVRYLIPTLYFNLKYLPFSQAVKLPIILYKPHLYKMRGRIVIEGGPIKTGMITLGFPRINLYSNSGFTYENFGGTIIFSGRIDIGNASALSIGSKGVLKIGCNFRANTSLKLVCYKNVMIGSNVRFGWDCVLMDTDLHVLSYLDEDKIIVARSRGCAPIVIGDGVWIGSNTFILKKSRVPDKCVIGAKSLVTGHSQMDSYNLYCGVPVGLSRYNVYWDFENDTVEY